MIRLYNTHTEEFLSLANEQSFSIQATNQLADLEKYDIGCSYDIELVNDANSRDASLYEYYASGGMQTITFLGVEVDVPVTKLPKVILYYDNVPMFIGRLSILGTTMTIIKCVYKCVPYGRAFNNFDMKPRLKDYFQQGVYQKHQFRNIIDSYWFEIKGGDKNPDRAYWPSLPCTVPNYSNDSLKPGHVFDTCCVIKNLENNKYVQYINNVGKDSGTEWFYLSPIDRLLEVMNIKTYFADEDRTIAHPISIHYKRDVKVRMYRNTVVANHVTFKPMERSEIWWINDSTHDWELLDANNFGFEQHREAFDGSLRLCKGLSGLRLKTVEYPVQSDGSVFKQNGLLTLNTTNAYKSIDFGFETGHEFKDGDDITMHLDRTNIHTQTLAQYVDVIFEFEPNFTPELLQEYNKATDMYTLWRSVPVMPYDIGLLEMETTEFLNQLSLNHKEYEWLRNPMYFTPDNLFQIHGIQPDDISRPNKICRLTNDMIEKISRSTKYDAPRAINIKVPTGFETICTKKLNDTLNDEKTIDMSMTGLGWYGYGLGAGDPALNTGITTTGFNPPKGIHRGTPPLILDQHDNSMKGKELKGCFGQVQTFSQHQRPGITFDRTFWYLSANNDFNYLEDYPDKTDKYELTVLGGGGSSHGYFMQPYIEIEGQKFIVESYKTSDFLKYNLVVYPATEWIRDREYNAPKYNVSTQTITIGSSYNPNDPASSRNEFYPNGRPVQRR